MYALLIYNLLIVLIIWLGFKVIRNVQVIQWTNLFNNHFSLTFTLMFFCNLNRIKNDFQRLRPHVMSWNHSAGVLVRCFFGVLFMKKWQHSYSIRWIFSVLTNICSFHQIDYVASLYCSLWNQCWSNWQMWFLHSNSNFTSKVLHCFYRALEVLRSGKAHSFFISKVT